MSLRPQFSTPALDAAEHRWWMEFAEAEDRFCWVQTPAIQQVIRRAYLQEIIRLTPPAGRIVELGCGTGWLCLLLAELGAEQVCGIDFAESQILRAQAGATALGLEGRVRFVCADGTKDQTGGERFDCVIIHGFLHHLSQSEIQTALASAARLLKPGGHLIVFEPAVAGAAAAPQPSGPEVWLRKLETLALRGQRWGLRRVSEEEARWREVIDRRPQGIAPHGPSPKEMPFQAGELESFLAAHFQLVQRRRCLGISHQVMQAWLLRELSHPLSTRLMLPFIARLAAALDRKLIAGNRVSAHLWTFDMFVCKAAADAV